MWPFKRTITVEVPDGHPLEQMSSEGFQNALRAFLNAEEARIWAALSTATNPRAVKLLPKLERMRGGKHFWVVAARIAKIEGVDISGKAA